MGQSSLQREMDMFLKEANDSEFAIRSITKSAFSQSRKQLKPEAFLELNDIVCRDFYAGAAYLGYRGHRLFSVDGSRLLLPNSEDIAKEFGTSGYGPNADVQRSLATISFLYDVGNYLVVDAQIADKEEGEQSLALKHLDKLSEGDLLLMDRGYPSKALFSILKSRGVHFCIRMKGNWWLQVKDFAESNKIDTEVTFQLADKDMQAYQESYPGMDKSVKCRLVKVKLDSGETEILCTSLLDQHEYPLSEFKELYHLRWGGEEGFKMYKSRVEIEAFTGKTAVSVKQDIFAKVMMMSLCAAFAFPIEQKVKQEYINATKLKHPQKINRTTAFANTKNITISLLIKERVNEALGALDIIIYKTREIVRPNRSNPRKHKPKRPHHMNYKKL